jgi:hypothetical protein
VLRGADARCNGNRGFASQARQHEGHDPDVAEGALRLREQSKAGAVRRAAFSRGVCSART